MELTVQVHVELLPEGMYLATSEELPGLIAQGRTVAETLEIARDVARKLIEARRERQGSPALPTSEQRRDFIKVEDPGALQVASRSQSLGKVREEIRKYIPANRDLVEELIHDRRVEVEPETGAQRPVAAPAVPTGRI